MTSVHQYVGQLRAGGWTLCGETFGGVAHCGLPRDNEWHVQAQKVGSMEQAAEPVTVSMEYPPREGPVIGDVPEGAAPETLDQQVRISAAQTLKDSVEGLFGPRKPEWELAVRWLTTEGISLRYGPWPVRKFVLPDLARSRSGGDGRELRRVMRALEDLEQEYSLSVTRPNGKDYREALLTWDWALGLGLEAAADEIAEHFG